VKTHGTVFSIENRFVLWCLQVVKEVAQSVKLHGLAGVCLLLMTFVL